ncbi:MAG TPA: IS21-like element helper ATPase IstB [Actinomycetes bacterium]|nr:IS21-like element helper ATPase IstB [Actinomycetes bacterium]
MSTTTPTTTPPARTSRTPAPTPPASSPRRAGLSEQAAVTAIDAACRTLHLPTIRDRAPEAIAAAERGRHTYAALLAELLLAECDTRDERRRARRVHEAGFPRPKRLDDFDTNANPNINPATLAMLATGDWVRTGTPVCLLGDSGTGKSHLLIGLGTAAAEAGHRVRYVLASRLVNELAEADNDRELTRVIARYGRIDLLCLDELGYLQLDRRGAELLFQVLTEREERNAIAIATNEPFSGWTKTFTDPRLCAAIVDRLTFNGHIIETGTTSYRLAHTRTHQPTGGAKSDRHSGATAG